MPYLISILVPLTLDTCGASIVLPHQLYNRGAANTIDSTLSTLLPAGSVVTRLKLQKRDCKISVL